MAAEMKHMQQDMDRGEMPPEARKAMAANMKRMSTMMARMSGWADRPTMKEPAMRKEFDDMRRQMDEMSKSHKH